MNILHVITTINRGGAENHLISLVEEQVKRGMQVTVCYLKGNGYWSNRMNNLGIHVVNLNLKYYGDLRALFSLRAVISQSKFDIIHAHLPPAELYSRVAMLLIKQPIKFIISKHNDEPFYRGLGSSTLGCWVAKHADKVIAISDSVNRYMRKNLSLGSDKLVTIHYGIDTIPYEMLNHDDILKLKELLIDGDKNTYLIGTVARLVPQKSLHTLLAAYHDYRKKSQVNSKLVIVGNGPLEKDLKDFASELGISDSLSWLGYREDIPLVISALDVFVLTSVYEGFGLVLLEAMAASKVIIASKVSAIPEIVTIETGHLVTAQDVTGFSNAFSAVENEEVRKKMGIAGYERAKKHFTIEAMSSKTLSVYQDILSQRNKIK